MDDVNNLLGERLKVLRGKRSTKDVELGCGIDRSRISRYERGVLSPEYSTLRILAQYYQVEIQELIELHFEKLYPAGSLLRKHLLVWTSKLI